jgi:putative PIN family toxin of toxin-antitoxin system
MKVVLDTNILASGAISATGTLSRVIDAWRSGQFKVIVSTPILDELERTFQKPYCIALDKLREHLAVASRFSALLRSPE